MYLLQSSQEMVGVVGVVWNSLLWDTSLYLHTARSSQQHTWHYANGEWIV
jgi:hypothetical protein